MRRFLQHVIAWPESPLRLLAAWFAACTVFEAFRALYLLPVWNYAVAIRRHQLAKRN